MAISISALITAYSALGTLVTATKTARNTLAGVGAIPAFPVDVLADADYNDVLTARATWLAAHDTAAIALNVAVAAQKAGEATVTALLPQNQWVKLTTLTNWGSAAAQHIGWPGVTPQTPGAVGTTLYTILATVGSPAPVNPFPDTATS